MKVERIWTKAKNNLIWWEFGDEQWVLLADKTIQHIKILSRKVISKDPFTLMEEILLLPETPVALEANQQEARGWQITEKVLDEKKEPLLPVPQTQTIQHSKKPQQAQPLLNYTPPEKLKSEPTSIEGESSQYTVNLPTELWLSLSQWIPPNALFQPSLHHQAILELSDNCRVFNDKPNQTFVPRSKQQQLRPQHHFMRNEGNRYGVKGMPPRHANEVSSHKQKVYRQDYSAKPLFV